MPSRRQPSSGRVSGLDIMAVLEEIWRERCVTDVFTHMSTNRLGGVVISTTIEYTKEDEQWEVLSEDYWSPNSAPIEVHIYRSVFNAHHELGRDLASIRTFAARRVEALPPLPS